MDIFREREEGFEAKFRQDQELAFKVAARRDKHLGLWAAAQLGLTGAEVETYAQALVETGFRGATDVLERVKRDFRAAQIGSADRVIAAEFERQDALARRDILG